MTAADAIQAMPELEDEIEGEWETEWESEWEDEGETEEFFRRIAAVARGALQSPTGQAIRQRLRRAGLSAARSAVGSLGGIGGALGGTAGSAGNVIGTSIGSGLGSYLGSFIPQQEFEVEGEWEEEGEWEGMVGHPMNRVPPVAVMEHLGHAAAQTESEAEAEAFIGALIPLAARVLPRAAGAVMRAAPQLIRGASRVARTLRRNPATRPLVRTLPTIVRRTAASMARQASQGQPVSPQGAVRTLAGQAAQVLSRPDQCVRAYQQSRALDRQFHRAARGRAGAAAQ